MFFLHVKTHLMMLALASILSCESKHQQRTKVVSSGIPWLCSITCSVPHCVVNISSFPWVCTVTQHKRNVHTVSEIKSPENRMSQFWCRRRLFSVSQPIFINLSHASHTIYHTIFSSCLKLVSAVSTAQGGPGHHL